MILPKSHIFLHCILQILHFTYRANADHFLAFLPHLSISRNKYERDIEAHTSAITKRCESPVRVAAEFTYTRRVRVYSSFAVKNDRMAFSTRVLSLGSTAGRKYRAARSGIANVTLRLAA